MIQNKRDMLPFVGTRQLVSTAGGRNRYLAIEEDGTDVVGLLYGNEIIRWRSSTVQLWTRGHVSPSTFDALAWALDIGRGGQVCGTVHRVPYALGHVLREGIMLDVESGALVLDGDALHLAPGRGGGDLVVERVAPARGGRDADIVEIVDRRSTASSDTIRRVAAAAAGRPRARTRALSAAPGPHGSALHRIQVLP